jgi:hypothetical protein
MATLLATRVPFDASVARAPGSLYTLDDDGFVRNTYLLRISNNLTGAPVAFTVEVDGLDGAEVTMAPLELASTEGRVVPLVVRVPNAARRGARFP